MTTRPPATPPKATSAPPTDVVPLLCAPSLTSTSMLTAFQTASRVSTGSPCDQGGANTLFCLPSKAVCIGGLCTACTQ